MRTTTISSKGQVTIPAALLREQHLEPGTQLTVIPLANGLALVERPASVTDAVAGATEGLYGEDYLDAEREWR